MFDSLHPASGSRLCCRKVLPQGRKMTSGSEWKRQKGEAQRIIPEGSQVTIQRNFCFEVTNRRWK